SRPNADALVIAPESSWLSFGTAPNHSGKAVDASSRHVSMPTAVAFTIDPSPKNTRCRRGAIAVLPANRTAVPSASVHVDPSPQSKDVDAGMSMGALEAIDTLAPATVAIQGHVRATAFRNVSAVEWLSSV